MTNGRQVLCPRELRAPTCADPSSLRQLKGQLAPTSTSMMRLPETGVKRISALHPAGAPVALKLYPKVAHADTVAAISLPARGRAPTLTDIASFLRQPRSS